MCIGGGDVGWCLKWFSLIPLWWLACSDFLSLLSQLGKQHISLKNSFHFGFKVYLQGYANIFFILKNSSDIFHLFLIFVFPPFCPWLCQLIVYFVGLISNNDTYLDLQNASCSWFFWVNSPWYALCPFSMWYIYISGVTLELQISVVVLFHCFDFLLWGHLLCIYCIFFSYIVYQWLSLETCYPFCIFLQCNWGEV